MKNTLLAALAAAVLIHLITGWSPALVVIPLYAVIIRLTVSTWGDGLRAMRLCGEDDRDA